LADPVLRQYKLAVLQVNPTCAEVAGSRLPIVVRTGSRWSVDTLTAQGVEILINDLLDVDQGTLPWTAAVMFQGGDHDGLRIIPLPHCLHAAYPTSLVNFTLFGRFASSVLTV
jgi:hypothetical protein